MRLIPLQNLLLKVYLRLANLLASLLLSEKIQDKTVFSLLEVTESIRKAISERYKSAYWIRAEMNKLNYYKQSGHCYPELVEKRSGKVVALIRAILWKEDYEAMNQRFLNALQEPLKDGIKILFLARIIFDPLHGMSLRILEIDPYYTLGDLEKEKQATIDRLKAEDLFTRNKKLALPLLPQRIAIVSVESSKGYADFLKIIDHNPWGYRFFHMLFPALLQGENATLSIIRQLINIRKVKDHFDVVAIIRGGGGDVGLSCYNDYKLAKEIALFPIPVITGIGHATNETVAEMIAFQNAITPTKIAEYLIQQLHNFSVPLQNAQDIITITAERILKEETNRLLHTSRLFRSVVSRQLVINNNSIVRQVTALFQFSRFTFRSEKDRTKTLSQKLQQNIRYRLNEMSAILLQSAQSMNADSRRKLYRSVETIVHQKNLLQHSITNFQKFKLSELKNLEININNLDPVNVLKRGFTITLHKGRAITSVDEINKGEILETITVDGVVKSNVQSKENKKNNE
jgi:exodeoxyribonuclease VII large subunit